ncbi:MAG: hypothetical protein JRJ13_14100 [Deltaproteobacteria bacterium]|nr:hypothetical protein [Deltaproteobacteria bacterium]
MRVSLDQEALGITERSLKILRDEIARRVDHDLMVLEIPTSDITCSYLIVDRTVNQAVFTGDGFRTDGGGEGGAGYRAAEAYLDIFRLKPYFTPACHGQSGREPVDMAEAYTGNTEPLIARLGELAQEALDNSPDPFVTPSNTTPSYMRGHLR